MSVDERLEREYDALRAEMIQRFDWIHSMFKFGSVAVIGLIAWLLSDENKNITDEMALTLVEAIVFAVGLISLSQSRIIYRIGTYIATSLEHRNSRKWIRMARNYPSYCAKNDMKLSVGESWGEDTRIFALLIFLLAAIGVGAFHGALHPFGWGSLIPIPILVGNYWVAFSLAFRMGAQRERTETNWRSFENHWGTQSFPDPYEENQSPPTEVAPPTLSTLKGDD